MVSSSFHQIHNNFSNWNVLYAVLFEKQIYNSRTFNGKNRWIINNVTVLKKLLPHLVTRGTYSPGDWRCDEAWREQTLVYPPVMWQQRLIYCTWELSVMDTSYPCGMNFAFVQENYHNTAHTTFNLATPLKVNLIHPVHPLITWRCNLSKKAETIQLCHDIAYMLAELSVPSHVTTTCPVPISVYKPYYAGIGIPILKIRWSWDRLIFIMGMPMQIWRRLYIEMAPRLCQKLAQMMKG